MHRQSEVKSLGGIDIGPVVVDAVAYEDAVALWNTSRRSCHILFDSYHQYVPDIKQNYLPPTFKLILQVYSIPARANAKNDLCSVAVT
jgi:hypothetical protein